MKKFNKIMTVLVVMVAVLAFVSPVFGTAFNPENITGLEGDANTDVRTVTGRVWATVISVVQVLAVGAVVIAGLRYMFASADAKADIKKQTIILVVGAVLIFGATYVVQLISNVANEAVKVNPPTV